MTRIRRLEGPRAVFSQYDDGYPEPLLHIRKPPKHLYVIGNPAALVSGLAVIGARKATPYGAGCAQRFARLAAEKGICIISGGARGCDSEAHRAALAAGGPTVVFLGGGCDKPYPSEHALLYQQIVDGGGAIVSEHEWLTDPRPYMFRERNRLIAGLADAVLIVEAGLPSGTFSTADDALDAGKDVYVVPGAITSSSSMGSNRLLLQGATPIIDDDTFEGALFDTFGALVREQSKISHADDPELAPPASEDAIVAAVLANPSTTEELYQVAIAAYGGENAREKLMERLVEAESHRLIARQPDGRWGPVVKG